MGWEDMGQTITEFRGTNVMPYPYSPYQEMSQGVSGLGNSLQGIAVGLAQLRAQQEQARQNLMMRQEELRQQGEMHRSQMKLYEQHGALYAAQAKLAEHKAQGDSDSGVIMGDIVNFLRRNPALPEEERAKYEAKALELATRGAMSGDVGAQHVPTSVAQVLEQARSPEFGRVLAAGGERNLRFNVPAGATAVSSVPGIPTVQGGVNVPQGGQFYGPQIGGDPLAQRTLTASGLPPKEGTDTEVSRDLGRLIQLYGMTAPGGVALDETNPLYQVAVKGIPELANKAMENVRKNTKGVPKVGEVKSGYRFKGGNPADRNNWEKVQ